MTARIIPFPHTRFVIRVERERDSGAWLVVTYKGHAWLHDDRRAAIDGAIEIAYGFGTAVKVVP